MNRRFHALIPPLMVGGLVILPLACAKKDSAPAPVATNQAPTITTQPTAQTVTAPAPATFTVAAKGTPDPTYQWNLGGQPIPGAQAATYTTPATSADMSGGSYTVTVTNPAGTVTSAPAVLTVQTLPVITTQPQAQAAYAGRSATFAVTASGVPAPTYQWNLGGQPIPGAQAATYTTPATTAAMSLGSYTVTVTNAAGSVTSEAATLTVLQPLTITGKVLDAAGQPLAGAVVTLDSNPATTATTDAAGSYAFTQSVLPGSYTLTPTLPGCSTWFWPSVLPVTVAASDVALPTVLLAAKAFNLQGSIAYSGTQSGPIYVNVVANSSAIRGVCLPAPGAFTVRGVPAGTAYKVEAFMDLGSKGFQGANDPAGVSASFEVGADGATTPQNPSLTLTDPAWNLAGQPGPTIRQVASMASGTLVTFDSIRDAGDRDGAQAYVLEWSLDPAFSVVAGSRPVSAPKLRIVALGPEAGLADGSPCFFRMRGLAGSGASQKASANSSVFGPVTIGAGKGASAMSGTVTFPGIAQGPLYLFLIDVKEQIFAMAVQQPISPQAFTLSGVPPGTYQVVVWLDQNRDGLLGPGDLFNGGPGDFPVLAVTGNLSGQTFKLAADFPVWVETGHTFRHDQAESYTLSLHSSPVIPRQIATMTLVSSAHAPVPADFIIDKYGYIRFPEINRSIAPEVGTPYGSLQVTYGDGTQELLTPKVTGVLPLPLDLTVSTTAPASATQPTFSWSAPTDPAWSTWFGVGSWAVPKRSGFLGLPSTINSIAWDKDPINPDNHPSAPSLTVGISVGWWVEFKDGQGNYSSTYSNYQP